MKRLHLFVLLIALTLIAAPALAQPKQGKYEASLATSYWVMKEADDAMALTARLGLYFTDDLSFGASVSGNFSGDEQIVTTFVDGRYYFQIPAPVTPYAGGRVGAAHIDYDEQDNETLMGVGGFAGARFLIAPRWGVFVQVGQDFYFGGESERLTEISFGANFTF